MWIVNFVALLLCIMWVVMFFKQSRAGLKSTALNDKFTWGLYVQAFFFFSALAGGILVFISVVTLFEIGSLRKLAEISSAVSFGCLVAAGMSLGSDLGKPFRSLRIATGKNFASPLTWDFITLSICGILNLAFLLGIIPGRGVIAMIWALGCLMAALGFVMIHTLFFLSRVGAGFRSQPFLGLNTLAHSLWGGTALIVLLTVVLKLGPFNMLRILLILTILVLIPQAGSTIATLAARNRGSETKRIIAMDALLLLILILIQIGGPDNPLLLSIGSILILIAVFLEKSHLIRQYQAKPILPLPYSRYEDIPAYSPTSYEWFMSLGSVGACVLVTSIIFYLKPDLLF
jgi:Ni/Fe-hydrogenase subunit HybB-like protein